MDKRNFVLKISYKGKKFPKKSQLWRKVNRFLEDIKIKADSGYQGISKLHKNSEIPKKKPRNKDLSNKEKIENKELSKVRVLIENINAKIKVFKIVANKYRNRRKSLAYE
ncbi:MAG: hypothetical protein LBF32_03455 [Streptococcaceae bacterium]|jgi:hypothetical protein|nr:hypothetical protein [Streptococcaceae bacterium]